MDKIRTFTIELRNPQGVYYPRQVVRGEVILVLDAPAKVRGEGFLCWKQNVFLFLGLENRCIDSFYYLETLNKTKKPIFPTNKKKIKYKNKKNPVWQMLYRSLCMYVFFLI